MRKVAQGILSLLVWCVMLSAGCAGDSSRAAATEATDSVPTLPLPQLPAELREPQQRAAYMAVHFWDALSLQSQTLRRDTAFMEQNFANFLAVLPYAPDDAISEAMRRLVAQCAADSEGVRLLEEVGRKYLADPNSPMRSEELYIPMLKAFAETETLPDDVRVRSEERLAQAMKNRPGMPAADLTLLLPDGRGTTLRRIAAGDTTVVMFYDPDCDKCSEITQRLSAPDARIPYRIVAVDVAGDRRAWEASLGKLPGQWRVAFARDAAQVDEVYDLPALPAFYLLAPDGTVLLKDFPIAGPAN